MPKGSVVMSIYLIEAELKVRHLYSVEATSEEEAKIPELIDKLDDIKDDLASYGIDFEYTIRDFHDRCIKTDTGWIITLGRGLDMFEKYSPFSIANSRQDKRKCKECMITYMKSKSI